MTYLEELVFGVAVEALEVGDGAPGVAGHVQGELQARRDLVRVVAEEAPLVPVVEGRLVPDQDRVVVGVILHELEAQVAAPDEVLERRDDCGAEDGDQVRAQHAAVVEDGARDAVGHRLGGAPRDGRRTNALIHDELVQVAGAADGVEAKNVDGLRSKQ